MRVRKLIEGFALSPESNLSQIYIFKLLKRLLVPGQFLPESFLSQTELCRLSLSSYGKIMYTTFHNRSMSNNQKKLVLTSFIILKNLIARILLQPAFYLSKSLSTNAADNLKYLGSTLFYIAVDAVDEMFEDEYVGKSGRGVGMYSRADLHLVLGKEWVGRMKQLLKDWLNCCLKLIDEVKC
eukprot:TRINITY_DN13430_c0_g5_i1.p1 TRINITY_DN13430_c0_g5~~TRINITY_DN13430_c0_g5_i1.p1  ORF type:complete len:212 (-),score=47.63 TRINITY_DN13430_c0_g5_i1:83-628(-)